ncbi:hypothetical protein SCLARK_001095 [Spiroplasma clarkii]|uniref:hypothetical protein n=1 Tax=Spiroplasma clarkii TaxID=2139 RepID=UPI000B555364|nr:hypothetical protein [Spiroplasma clarkii]ARU91664.1 hypothetical protein SCLARK_001095 [Spiroplasma clarkii]
MRTDYPFLETWINDSYTKASDDSLQLFQDANSNHFADFATLDNFFSENTKDVTGVSQIWLSNSFQAIEAEYLNYSTNSDTEKWTEATTEKLRESTLRMFNYLYTFANNEIWFKRMCSALIFAEDDSLVGHDSSTLGVTSTSYLSNNSSTYESYVVILGKALLLKEFNTQYQLGFWSSPEKFAVIIHEFGHVLDGFGGKRNVLRPEDNSQASTLSSKYEGKMFGIARNNPSNGLLSSFFIFVIVLVSVAAVVGITVSVIMLVPKKKKG